MAFGLGFGFPRGRYPGTAPALSYNFVGANTLPSSIAFSRAGAATYFDSLGALTTATTNTPRFDYNPVTLSPRGLLIEESRTNLVTFSDAWIIISAGSTCVKNATGPDGLANSAWTFTEATGLAQSIVSPGSSTLTATFHTQSMFVKAGTATRCQIATPAAISSEYANFSLVGAGSVLVQNASNNATITQLSDGWFRVSMGYTSLAATGRVFLVAIDSNTAGRIPTFVGTGLTLFVYGGQVEVGGFATSFIPTSGSAVSRGVDTVDIVPAVPYSALGTTYYTSYARSGFAASGTVTSVFFIGDTADTFVGAVFGAGTPAQQRMDLRVSTVAQAQLSVAFGTVGTVYKSAARFAPNDAIMYQNAVASAPDNTVIMPISIPTTYQNLGKYDGGATMCGWVREFKVYTVGLSNSQLQALTT